MERKLILNYDKEVDVLYASIDKPKPAICVELDEGFILRLSPDDNEIVGFTIVDYEKRVIRWKEK